MYSGLRMYPRRVCRCAVRVLSPLGRVVCPETLEKSNVERCLTVWIFVSMFVLFGGVFFLVNQYDDRKDMSSVDLSEKRIEELLRELQGDPQFNDEVRRLKNQTGNHVLRGADAQEKAEIEQLLHNHEIRNRNKKPSKSRTTRKPRPRRFDYDIPEDDLPANQVAKLLHIYDVSEPIRGLDYECVSLSMRPNVPVCLYPDNVDVHVSATIRKEGTWEPHIVKEFQNYLYSDPEIGFIDIGANIGVYSLIALAMGHHVVAVEPLEENLRHFHAAIQIGNFSDHVTVLQNAISDSRTRVTLSVPKDNQGGTALHADQSEHGDGGREACSDSQSDHCVQAIHMDDLTGVLPFKRAVMKMDIEGHEARALRHAMRLLRHTYVPCIFMEWMKLREFYGAEITDTPDKDLVFELVDWLTGNGYQPYSLVRGSRLKTGYWYGWPSDIVWKHELQDLV